ncbi:helix-turn-helix domain-containing protein [Streptomyces sp. NBC_01483]|uniref:helix-turn-helix domain-containing protein n=1 Tax=Streptomyces sp. NBC_01483 TaxID=2903883 RepID=UPI002E2EF37E|nr:helix-turn-helix domain-containing protein [Streptomyces sp. NBC_01483]
MRGFKAPSTGRARCTTAASSPRTRRLGGTAPLCSTLEQPAAARTAAGWWDTPNRRDYRRDLRLCRARALLAEGTAPSMAAAEAGFADQAHLTRWFTRTYGVTPATYRSTLHSESVP